MSYNLYKSEEVREGEPLILVPAGKLKIYCSENAILSIL